MSDHRIPNFFAVLHPTNLFKAFVGVASVVAGTRTTAARPADVFLRPDAPLHSAITRPESSAQPALPAPTRLATHAGARRGLTSTWLPQHLNGSEVFGTQCERLGCAPAPAPTPALAPAPASRRT